MASAVVAPNFPLKSPGAHEYLVVPFRCNLSQNHCTGANQKVDEEEDTEHRNEENEAVPDSVANGVAMKGGNEKTK